VEAGEDLVVEAPSGRRTIVRAGAAERVVEVAEQGFFEIRQLEAGEVPPTYVAVNLDPEESDLSKLDTDEFLGAMTPIEGRGGAAARARTLTIEDRERRQQLWWYLLIGAMLVLVMETAVSNRLSRVAR
jgi:hypothetical protein